MHVRRLRIAKEITIRKKQREQFLRLTQNHKYFMFPLARMEKLITHELSGQVFSGVFPHQWAKVNPRLKDGSCHTLKNFKARPKGIKLFLHNCSTSRMNLKNIYRNTNVSINPVNKIYNVWYLIKNYQAYKEPITRRGNNH